MAIRRGDLSSIPAGQLAVRPHCIGNIKIGQLGQKRQSKSGGEYQQPLKLDHFIITHKHRGDDGNFVPDTEAMRAIGNPQPKSLKVFLPYQDPNKNLVVFYASYSKSKCLCRGNGQVALKLNDRKLYDEIACRGDACPDYEKKLCKLTGILSVVLADIPRVGGVHLFRTTSFYSITALQASMNMILGMTDGNIAGVPLELVIRPDTRQPEGQNKVTIYTVNLEYAGSIASLRQSSLVLAQGHANFRSQLALAESTIKKDLDELVTPEELNEDAAGIQREFYPEAEPPAPSYDKGLMPDVIDVEPEPEPVPPPAPTPEAEHDEAVQVADVATIRRACQAKGIGTPSPELNDILMKLGHADGTKVGTLKPAQLKALYQAILKWEPPPADDIPFGEPTEREKLLAKVREWQDGGADLGLALRSIGKDKSKLADLTDTELKALLVDLKEQNQ